MSSISVATITSEGVHPAFVSPQVDWGYVAGIFDGEGSVSLNKSQMGLAFHNSHKPMIEAIKTFLSAGHIYQRLPESNALQRKTMYVLNIVRINDLRRILPDMLSRCIIKHDKLVSLGAALQGRKPATNYRGERLASVSPEEIRRLYWDEGLTLKQIGQQFAIHKASVSSFMRQHGIPRRKDAGRRHLHLAWKACREKREEARKQIASKICAVCGRIFQPDRPSASKQKFCSQACAWEAQKHPFRSCDVCGRAFHAEKRLQRFCSIACANRTNHQRRKHP